MSHNVYIYLLSVWQDSKSVDVVTPKIDQALEKFRQRKSPTFTSEMSATASDADTSAGISVSLAPMQGVTITHCNS